MITKEDEVRIKLDEILRQLALLRAAIVPKKTTPAPDSGGGPGPK